jgi:hypothetical protein
MSTSRPTIAARARWRRAPRPLGVALVELLHAHRPPLLDDGAPVWICVSPRRRRRSHGVAARRAGSIARQHEHPVHAAALGPIRVDAATAQQWRGDAWRAAGEGLIAVGDALALAAQIDASGAA